MEEWRVCHTKGYGKTERQIDRQNDRPTMSWQQAIIISQNGTDRQTDKIINFINVLVAREHYIQKRHRQIDRSTDRQIDRSTDRQIDSQKKGLADPLPPLRVGSVV